MQAAILYIVLLLYSSLCLSHYPIDPHIWTKKTSVALDQERLKVFNYILSLYQNYYRAELLKNHKGHHKHFKLIKKNCHLEKVYLLEEISPGKQLYWWAGCKQKYLRKSECHTLIYYLYEWLTVKDPDFLIALHEEEDSEPDPASASYGL